MFKFNKIKNVDLLEISKFREEKNTFSVLTNNEINKLIDYLNSSLLKNQNKLLIYLLIDTGARISEILNIKISNINYSNNTIYLDVTKTHNSRYVPYTEATKVLLKKYIEEKYGYEVVNYGTDSTERFNYPVSGEAVANAVVSGEVDKGIVICGTGVGISLAANKVNGIRCVTCSEPYSALLSRQHNNTNMLAFGARVVGIELAKMIVDAWLSGEYEGGRHQVRIDMLKEIEEKQKNK